MTRAILFLVCLGPICVSQATAQDDARESESVFAVECGIPFDAEALRTLKEEVSNASSEQIFAVHLVFDEPVSVQHVDAGVLELQIPRVLAYIDYGPLFDDRPRDFLILGLGEMYAGEVARRHTQSRQLAKAVQEGRS